MNIPSREQAETWIEEARAVNPFTRYCMELSRTRLVLIRVHDTSMHLTPRSLLPSQAVSTDQPFSARTSSPAYPSATNFKGEKNEFKNNKARIHSPEI